MKQASLFKYFGSNTPAPKPSIQASASANSTGDKEELVSKSTNSEISSIKRPMSTPLSAQSASKLPTSSSITSCSPKLSEPDCRLENPTFSISPYFQAGRTTKPILDLCGKTIRIWWTAEDRWNYARVISYDVQSGLHKILYTKPPTTTKRPGRMVIEDSDDEDEEEVNLLKEKYELVNPPSSSIDLTIVDAVTPAKRKAVSTASTTSSKKSRKSANSDDDEFNVSDSDESESDDEDDDNDDDDDDDDVPKRKTSRPSKKSVSSGNRKSVSTPKQTKMSQSSDDFVCDGVASPESSQHAGTRMNFDHYGYSWLFPSLSMSRSSLNADAIIDYFDRNYYRPHLYRTQTRPPCTPVMPASTAKALTPGMKQWWKIKLDGNMDKLLLFKMGKFYEMYHMDSDVAVKECGLVYMISAAAKPPVPSHCGFPEASYDKMEKILVGDLGYKVVRVEQTETPQQMTERTKGVKGSDKVVRREVCNISSKGTRISDVQSSILMCIRMQRDADRLLFGVCTVQSHLSKIYFSHFSDHCDVINPNRNKMREDDWKDQQLESQVHLTNLHTLLSHFKPNEIWIAVNNNDGDGNDWQLVRSFLFRKFPGTSVDILDNACNKYDDALLDVAEYANDYHGVFDQLSRQATNDGNRDEMIGSQLCIMSLAVCYKKMKEFLIAEDVVEMKRFFIYSINNNSKDSKVDDELDGDETSFTLDGITVDNLELFNNSFDKSTKGTMIELLTMAAIHAPKTRGSGSRRRIGCLTPFGKRMMHEWLLRPLKSAKLIHDRLDAVQDLRDMIVKCMEGSSELWNTFNKMLLDYDSLPDIERAIFYDKPSRRSNDCFLSIVKAFETIERIRQGIVDCVRLMMNDGGLTVDSSFLNSFDVDRRHGTDGDSFTDARGDIDHFLSFLQPSGIDGEFELDLSSLLKDEAYEALVASERDIVDTRLPEFLHDIQKKMKNQSICFYKSTASSKKKKANSNRAQPASSYEIEVPEVSVNNVPSDFELKGKRKGFQRYSCRFIDDQLEQLEKVQAQLQEAEKEGLRQLMSLFDSKREIWLSCLDKVSCLDVLLSFACLATSRSTDSTLEFSYSRPVFVDDQLSSSSDQFIHIRQGRHACLEQLVSADGKFVANDTILGGTASDLNGDLVEDAGTFLPRLVLLTGPNMGGKSTILRQTCLIVLMAQIGSFVPASSSTFGLRMRRPVDRIFTRIGASDAILEGKSTFLVEMSETSKILHEATRDSLVIIDELGRGTCTFDGASVAHSVIQELVTHIKCPCLFSTHYHSLLHDWSIDPRVRLAHMDFILDDSREKDDVKMLVFLYRIVDGPCSASHGTNVAQLAGLPQKVVQAAYERSKTFEGLMKEKAGSSQDADIASCNACLTSLVKSSMRVNGTSQEDEFVFRELWNRARQMLMRI